MLKKFYVRNYKNIAIQHPFVFNKLNIFIGPNSGKSNLFDAMTYLADLFETGFEQSVQKRDYRAILNRYTENDKVSFQYTI